MIINISIIMILLIILIVIIPLRSKSGGMASSYVILHYLTLNTYEVLRYPV